MTNLPDWLVERVALDEVPRSSRARVDAADAGEPRESLARSNFRYANVSPDREHRAEWNSGSACGASTMPGPHVAMNSRSLRPW
jgi:hypothetical protein